MNLIPWRREGNGINVLKKQLNRLFEDFGGFDEEFFAPLDLSRSRGPDLDLAETPESFVIKAEVPGIDPKDIDISVTGNTLTVRGEKHEEKEEKGKTWLRVERSYGAFNRSVTLPVAVKADKIEAESKDGILTITLPKSVEALPKKIAVKTK
jgi:HSP20 family protein